MGKSTWKRTVMFNSVRRKLIVELDEAAEVMGWTRNKALARLVAAEGFPAMVEAGLRADCERLARERKKGRPVATLERLNFDLPGHLAQRLSAVAKEAGCPSGDAMAAALTAASGRMTLALLGTILLSPEDKKILASTP